MLEVVYLSHPFNKETPLYKGANEIIIKQKTSIVSGSTTNSLSIAFPSHSSTHVDVPYHFFEDGKKLTDYDASFWIFNRPQCIDVCVGSNGLITFEDIKNKLKPGTDLLLIRTGFERFRSEEQYWKESPGISPGLASKLRSNHPHIRAFGLDTISISSLGHSVQGREAHKEFLGPHYSSDPIVIIEDMKVSNFHEKISQVIILPIMVSLADGCPSTIIGY